MISSARKRASQLIERLESILKTDVRYILKGGFWLTFGRIASMLASFLLSLAYANLLSKETYGSYKFVLSIASMLSLFTLPGINTALSQTVARGYEGTLVPSTLERIRWSILGTCVGIGVAGYYFFIGHNQTLALAALIIAAFLPVMDTLMTYSAFLQGQKKFKLDALLSSATQISGTLALIVTFFLTKNLLYILLTYFFVYTCLRAIFFFYTQKTQQTTNLTDARALTYGKHLSAMNILGTIAGNVDDIILFHVMGPVGVARYNIAVAPADQAKGLLSFSDPLLFPQFSKHSEEDIRRHIGKKFFWYGVFGAVIVGAYWLVTPWFFRIFLPKYTEIIFLSLLYSLSMLNAVVAPAATYLVAKRKVKEQYYLNLITYIFQIGSMAFLTVTHGLLGLIIARIATRFFGGALSVFFFVRPFKQAET